MFTINLIKLQNKLNTLYYNNNNIQGEKSAECCPTLVCSQQQVDEKGTVSCAQRCANPYLWERILGTTDEA